MSVSEKSNDYCFEKYFKIPDSFFYDISPDEKEQLCENHTCHIYNRHDMIFRKGEKPEGLMCMVRGKAKIIKEGVSAREQIIRMASPPGFIGYRALFAGEPYRSSAIALEESLVCEINRNILFSIMENKSKLTLRILKLLALELGFTCDRIVSLTQKHTRGRLAESLLILIDMYGYEEDNRTIKVSLQREDIATLSNMTTSNAIRTLSEFTSENIIGLNKKKIIVLDKCKLERISKTG